MYKLYECKKDHWASERGLAVTYNKEYIYPEQTKTVTMDDGSVVIWCMMH